MNLTFWTIVGLAMILVGFVIWGIRAKQRDHCSEKRERKCRKDIFYVLTCPYACRDCPVRDLYEIERIEIPSEAILLPRNGFDLCPFDEPEQSYYYFQITDRRTGEKGFAIERKLKNGRSCFVWVPVKKNKK